MNCGCEAIVNYGVSMFVKHCPRHSEENVARLEGIIVESIENGAPMAEWKDYVEQSHKLATTKAALARLVAAAETADMALRFAVEACDWFVLGHDGHAANAKTPEQVADRLEDIDNELRAAIAAAEEAKRD